MQRNTVQRQIILDTLQKLKTHPSIDEVYAMAHKEHPSISISTVYRNLRRLAKDKIIRRITLLDGLERYDHRPGRHYHFKCANCGVIQDVDINETDYFVDLDYAVERTYGFAVDEHDIAFSGLCEKCK